MRLVGLRGGLAVWCVLVSAVFSATPPSEELLPTATKAWISSANVPQMTERWGSTQLGKLLETPEMDPFMQEVRKQARVEFQRTGTDLRITFDDIQDLARGEAAAALIHLTGKRPATALLIDITDNRAKATEVLNRVFKEQAARKATFSQPKILDNQVTIFNLPKDPKQPSHAPQAVYFVKENLLCAVDSLDVAKGILERYAGSAKEGLNTLPGFRKVMDRCQADDEQSEKAAPQFRWYMNPWEFADAQRLLDPEFLKSDKLDMLKAFKAAGFTSLQAVGGYVHLAEGEYDILQRVAVYAPPPFEKSMKMLAFPNGPAIVPPKWIPAEMASYAAFNCDLKTAIANFGPLFDQTVGGGDEGTWADTLESIRTDKKGPQIDLDKELFAFLGSKVTLVADLRLPVTPTSERTMFIAGLDNEAAVQKALQRYYEKDPTARKRTLDSFEYWEILPEEDEDVAEIPDLKVETTGADGVVNTSLTQAKKVAPEPSAVCVAHGHLLIASHVQLLIKILKPAPGTKPLTEAVDYQLVLGHINSEIKRRAWPAHSLQRFTRPEEAFQGVYELTRMNKLPESESILAQALNSVLSSGAAGQPRKQRVDGKKLPEFSVVKPYLTPIGSVGLTEEGEAFHGWFMVDFTLGKGPTAKPAATP